MMFIKLHTICLRHKKTLNFFLFINNNKNYNINEFNALAILQILKICLHVNAMSQNDRSGYYFVIYSEHWSKFKALNHVVCCLLA